MEFWTPYQFEAACMWLMSYATLVILALLAFRFMIRGFTEYPWPEWATLSRVRRTGAEDIAATSPASQGDA